MRHVAWAYRFDTIGRLLLVWGGAAPVIPFEAAYIHTISPTDRPTYSTHTHTRRHQSPKGIALRAMLRSEFRRNANVSEPQQVEQLKMK